MNYDQDAYLAAKVAHVEASERANIARERFVAAIRSEAAGNAA